MVNVVTSGGKANVIPDTVSTEQKIEALWAALTSLGGLNSDQLYAFLNGLAVGGINPHLEAHRAMGLILGLAGTANQVGITVDSTTKIATLSLPQSIHTAADVAFKSVTASIAAPTNVPVITLNHAAGSGGGTTSTLLNGPEDIGYSADVVLFEFHTSGTAPVAGGSVATITLPTALPGPFLFNFTLFFNSTTGALLHIGVLATGSDGANFDVSTRVALPNNTDIFTVTFIKSFSF